MRKIFLLFLAISLLTGCENNPFAKKDNKEEKQDKDDDKNKDDDENDRNDKDDKSKDDDEDSGNDDTKGNWTSKQRTQWLNDCIDEAGNTPQAREICSCVLEKAEKKYPDVRDAEKLSEAEGERLARECMNGDNSDSDPDEEDYAGKDDQGSGGGSWSNLQRKQFIQGCATTARQAQGLTAQQANDYCDCMTRKVERKHSFNEAAKMTATDFQTQYWQNAAMDCRSRID